MTHCLWLVFAYLLLLAIKANAATLLKAGMADPDALVAGDYIYFAGTGGRMDTIDIFRMTVADFKAEMAKPNPNLVKQVSLYQTYNPRKSVIDFYGRSHRHRYCDIWAPDLAIVDGEIWLTFTAMFDALTDVPCGELRSVPRRWDLAPTLFYAKNFGTPLFFYYPTWRVHSHPVVSKKPTSDHMRIDSNMYVDNKGTPWLSYTWFVAGGNATASIDLKTGKRVQQTTPNFRYDEGITEASSFFYRDGWYYLLYSENFYNSKYQMYYKKARKIEDITTHTWSCRLTFNSWHNPPTATQAGFNAGHGTAIELEGEYYLVYHIGQGSQATFSRSTYVTKLEFYPSGNIKQIPAPDFVSPDNPLTGNLSHCY